MLLLAETMLERALEGDVVEARRMQRDLDVMRARIVLAPAIDGVVDAIVRVTEETLRGR